MFHDPQHRQLFEEYISVTEIILAKIPFACTFCFPNTDHVMILRRFDPYASMNMSACALFNEQDKGSNLLSTIT